MICKRCPVVVLVVPQALRCDSDTLSSDLADDCLHDDLVGRNVEGLHLHLYLVGDQLSHHLRSRVLVLLVLQVSQNNLLDALFNLRGIESIEDLAVNIRYLSCSRGSSL